MDEHDDDDDAGNSGETAPKRVVGRPFPKGVSGNPRGRPKTSEEFKQACMEKSPRALRCLVTEIKTGGDGRIKASEIILAYAHGKPSQKMEVGGADGGPIQVVIQKYGENED